MNYPFVRQGYNFGYYFLVRLLFGLPLHDTQTGLRVFRRRLLGDVFPRVLAKRFSFDIELLSNAHRLGYNITDAPVRPEFQRTMGRIKLKNVWVLGLDTLAIFYRLRLRRYYDDEPVVAQVNSHGRELTNSEIDAH